MLGIGAPYTRGLMVLTKAIILSTKIYSCLRINICITTWTWSCVFKQSSHSTDMFSENYSKLGGRYNYCTMSISKCQFPVTTDPSLLPARPVDLTLSDYQFISFRRHTLRPKECHHHGGSPSVLQLIVSETTQTRYTFRLYPPWISKHLKTP